MTNDPSRVGWNEPAALDAQTHEHVHLVGLLCNAWAEAEDRGREFFINVSDMRVTAKAYAIVRCLDMRDIYKASKVAIVFAWTDEKLRDEALDVITYIDETLRPARNRCVHDRWVTHHSLMETRRYNHTPKIRKPQSRQIAVEEVSISVPTAQELENLIYDIRHQASYLNAIMMCVRQHPHFPREDTLRERPQRRYVRH